MPNAEQLTAIAAIIAACTGLVTAVGGYFTHRTVTHTATVAETVATNTKTENGSTLGQNSDAVRNVVAPKAPGDDAPAEPAA